MLQRALIGFLVTLAATSGKGVAQSSPMPRRDSCSRSWLSLTKQESRAR